MKITLWIVAGLSVLLVAASVAAAIFMLKVALSVDNITITVEETIANKKEQEPRMVPWIDSLYAGAIKDTIITINGQKAAAHYVAAKNPTDKTAFLIHGYTTNHAAMLSLGYMYNHDLGYNIFMPDLYAHGQSEGDHIRMGWLDRLDVLRWMDIANEVFGGNTQMIVHGVSMGAATAMNVSGEAPKPYVKAFIEDCGYTSAWDEFRHELKKKYHLPPFPVLSLSSLICRKKYGWDFKEASPLKQVAKCSLPMMFIHGEMDDFVPTRMVHSLYEAKEGAKELWTVPETTHAMSYKNYPEEYTERVKNFLDKYIK